MREYEVHTYQCIHQLQLCIPFSISTLVHKIGHVIEGNIS